MKRPYLVLDDLRVPLEIKIYDNAINVTHNYVNYKYDRVMDNLPNNILKETYKTITLRVLLSVFKLSLSINNHLPERYTLPNKSYARTCIDDSLNILELHHRDVYKREYTFGIVKSSRGLKTQALMLDVLRENLSNIFDVRFPKYKYIIMRPTFTSNNMVVPIVFTTYPNGINSRTNALNITIISSMGIFPLEIIGDIIVIINNRIYLLDIKHSNKSVLYFSPKPLNLHTETPAMKDTDVDYPIFTAVVQRTSSGKYTITHTQSIYLFAKILHKLTFENKDILKYIDNTGAVRALATSSDYAGIREYLKLTT